LLDQEEFELDLQDLFFQLLDSVAIFMVNCGVIEAEMGKALSEGEDSNLLQRRDNWEAFSFVIVLTKRRNRDRLTRQRTR
jgi:hypothetical protein